MCNAAALKTHFLNKENVIVGGSHISQTEIIIVTHSTFKLFIHIFSCPSFFLLFVLVGCPFRHSDPELLKQKLQVYKVPPSGISQVGAVLSVSGPPAIINYL